MILLEWWNRQTRQIQNLFQKWVWVQVPLRVPIPSGRVRIVAEQNVEHSRWSILFNARTLLQKEIVLCERLLTTSKVIGLNLKPAKLTKKDCGVGDSRSNHNVRRRELKPTQLECCWYNLKKSTKHMILCRKGQCVREPLLTVPCKVKSNWAELL